MPFAHQGIQKHHSVVRYPVYAANVVVNYLFPFCVFKGTFHLCRCYWFRNINLIWSWCNTIYYLNMDAWKILRFHQVLCNFNGMAQSSFLILYCVRPAPRTSSERVVYNFDCVVNKGDQIRFWTTKTNVYHRTIGWFTQGYIPHNLPTVQYVRYYW